MAARQQMASGNTQLSNIIMVKVPDDTRPIILLNNPVHDFASLQIRSAGNTTAAIRILDATGRVLMSKQQQVMTGLNTLRFETNALPNGVYYLQIRMGDNSHFITLLKQ
ncbi:MAG: T9SS type A sorting domain-containing protein [Cyclobacteriaceae bacterium]|nr:T9SS type A sorting domain-containing protein [Cyclobacteriaceae bacterium]